MPLLILLMNDEDNSNNKLVNGNRHPKMTQDTTISFESFQYFQRQHSLS